MHCCSLLWRSREDSLVKRGWVFLTTVHSSLAAHSLSSICSLSSEETTWRHLHRCRYYGVWTDALRWCLDRRTHCVGRNTLSFCCSCRTSPCRVFVAVWAVNVFRFSLAYCRPKDRLFSLSCFSKFWKQYIFQLLCSQRGVMKLDCNETSYIYDRCKFQHDFSHWLSGQTLEQNKMKHRPASPRSQV